MRISLCAILIIVLGSCSARKKTVETEVGSDVVQYSSTKVGNWTRNTKGVFYFIKEDEKLFIKTQDVSVKFVDSMLSAGFFLKVIADSLNNTKLIVGKEMRPDEIKTKQINLSLDSTLKKCPFVYIGDFSSNEVYSIFISSLTEDKTRHYTCLDSKKVIVPIYDFMEDQVLQLSLISGVKQFDYLIKIYR